MVGISHDEEAYLIGQQNGVCFPKICPCGAGRLLDVTEIFGGKEIFVMCSAIQQTQSCRLSGVVPISTLESVLHQPTALRLEEEA
ncbi:hypothetical protein ACVBEF_01255 [Glaciimonas sp. GG7]